jgi:putative YphP/YqiW family bacilliredoxin
MAMNDLMILPMRQDLTRHGVRELKTAEEVDEVLADSKGTVAIAVNSVCGCSSSRMRPAFTNALKNDHVPDVVATVFAGQDHEATARAREYFTGYPASSPSVAILKDGRLVFMMERRDIEGRTPDAISQALRAAFAKFCAE